MEIQHHMWDEAKAVLRGTFIAPMIILEVKKGIKSINYIPTSRN